MVDSRRNSSDQSKTRNLRDSSIDIKTGTINADNLRRLVSSVVHWPPLWWQVWTVLVVMLVVLSATDISWVPPKPLSVDFHTTSTSAVLLALLWLPALLRILAVFGGRVHTTVGDIEMTGLLNGQPLEVLGLISYELARTPDLSVKDVQMPEALWQQVQSVMSQRVTREHLEQVLYELANRATRTVGEVRELQGDENATEINYLLGSILALIPSADFAEVNVVKLLRSEQPGRRLLGLAAVLHSRDSAFFENVQTIIKQPRSNLEYYWALRALEGMLEKLTLMQRDSASRVLSPSFDNKPVNLNLRHNVDIQHLLQRLREALRDELELTH